SRRKPLILNFLLSLPDPSSKRHVFGKSFDDCRIGRGDICWLSRERGPSECAGATAKKGPDELWNESWTVKDLLETSMVGDLAAQVVPIIERDRAAPFHLEHRTNMGDHG